MICAHRPGTPEAVSAGRPPAFPFRLDRRQSCPDRAPCAARSWSARIAATFESQEGTHEPDNAHSYGGSYIRPRARLSIRRGKPGHDGEGKEGGLPRPELSVLPCLRLAEKGHVQARGLERSRSVADRREGEAKRQRRQPRLAEELSRRQGTEEEVSCRS